MSTTVRTNNVPRDIIDACELTPREREPFDYLDWSAIDAGEDSASFFRYRGEVYDLGEFMANLRETGGTTGGPDLAGWDGYMADSYFSAIVVRFVGDGERVVVGLAIA